MDDLKSKSIKELLIILWSQIIRSSGCITIVIVLSAFIGARLLANYMTPESTHTWSAYYCHPNGCQAGNVAKSGSLNLEEGETLACPETIRVKRGAVLVGSAPIPVYDNYSLVPSTCQIQPIDE